MRTIDEIVIAAPVPTCFRLAANVESWPEVLQHYRWVRFARKDGFGAGRVEMAARRYFGPLPYPVWWVSEMRIEEARPAVLYEHVEGITRGMQVVWSFEYLGPSSTLVNIVHSWEDGPAWPVPRFLRRLIAEWIIGPVFIRNVAGRTLAGIGRRAERIETESRRTQNER